MNQVDKRFHPSHFGGVGTADKSQFYRLTHPQLRELITEKTYPDTGFANMPFSIKFKEPVDFNILENAINLVIRKHPGLRIRITEVDYNYKQYVQDYQFKNLEFLDFSGEFTRDRLKNWIIDKTTRQFALMDSDLYYFAMLRFNDGSEGFFINIHHIIGDGWTMNLVINQIVDFYFLLSSGDNPGDEEFPSYIEFIDSEQVYLDSPRFRQDKEYWSNVFNELPEEINIPYIKNKNYGIRASTASIEIPHSKRESVFNFCERNKTSFFRLVLASVYAYISRITSINDITIGTLSHNRSTPREKQMAGMFVNSFPLREQIDGEQSFGELLHSVSNNLVDNLKNYSKYPFDIMFKDIRDKHKTVPNLLNIILVGLTFINERVIMEYHHPGYEQPPYQLLVNTMIDGGPMNYRLLITYPHGMYDSADVERMGNHIINLMLSGLENPGKKLRQLEFLMESEKELLLHSFNNTERNYPYEKTIMELFNNNMNKFQDRTAVVFGEDSLSYEEFNKKINRMAQALINKGVAPETVIGIMAEPSMEMILGPMAILKSGAAYMPVDPRYSSERIKFMLEDTKAPIILTHKSLFDKLEGYAGEIMDIDLLSEIEGVGENPEIRSGSDNLAYVIFTSGSTGKPKGVMIEHRSLTNICLWQIETQNLSCADKCSKFAGFAFDVSVGEIFPPLLAGAEIHVIPDHMKMSPRLLNEYFETKGITASFLPTQFFEQFMELADNRSLRVVDTGGDKLKTFKKRNYTLLNKYGPTEFTIYTTSFNVDRFYDNIPIGKPCANAEIYILDKFNNLQPVGAPGELCVSGVGLARGYMNRIELTKEKFIPNPFRPGTLMYKTGDLSRWLADGNIEYLGRLDFQLKIRGFRIELGEIESRMLSLKGVREAVAMGRDDSSGNKYLCAYFVADQKISAEDFQKYLARQLPDYMIPPFMVQLDCMPLNPSGKIDRKQLPEPVISSDLVAPSNPMEKLLVNIWKEILGLEQIGITDNFFALGGHSLRAAQMLAQIESILGVELSFSQVFSNPTIKELAEIIRKARKVDSTLIEPSPPRDFYPVTSAQNRLFFIEQLKGVGTTYNIPIILEIRGKLDKKRLIDAFDRIVNRHEVFRTSFQVVNGMPMQKIHDSIRFKNIVKQIGKSEISEEIHSFIRPFDLLKPPLFRIELLEIEPEYNILAMDFHHTIFDGSSSIIFIKELAELYEGRDLPELLIQYKDYADWQSRIQESEDILRQESYWMDRFKGEIPILDLPTDFPRPVNADYYGDRFTLVFDEKTTEDLHRLCSKANKTLYMALMAAFNVLLARYTSQDDIVIGAGSAGRNRNTQDLIGMFVNTLPIRSFPEGGKEFSRLLEEIGNDLLNAYDNQSYQFEKLVENLKVKRDTGRNPLFDAAFVMQSMGLPRVHTNDISIEPFGYDHKIAHVDLMLEVIEDGGKLLLNWEYKTSLFRRRTIERIAGHYKNIVEGIILNPDQKINEMDFLSEGEKDALLYQFNRTDYSWPAEKTVHQIFEEAAEKFPERIAVSFEDQHLTYKELNKKSNQLARFLRKKGVKPDTIVGLMLEKCPEMIIGILGIIKAGGCYLPIKPDFPRDRIKFMLEDSSAPLLLTTKEFIEIPDNYKGEIIDFTSKSIFAGEDGKLENINSPGDMIYIIYTSGSTGRPKGVMLEHHNILRLFVNSAVGTPDYYSFDENDVWSMFHSFCFDFSVWEIYGALLYGGRVVMISKKDTVNPKEFLKILKKEKVTVLSQTPGAFYNLIEEDLKGNDRDLCIRYVTFGGEALKPGMLKEWNRKYPETKLINMYGITETTVHVTYKEITPHDIVEKISNIGVPIPNLHTYIMDKNSKLCPIGVPGEICVGGEGVARGYLGLPEKTAAVFIDNPYIPGERIYKSGDLARVMPNGEMEYLGRIDFQVKIRGFRIELGEIENRLLKNDNISKAVVIAKDDKEGNKFLAAYIVLENDMTITQLREYLLKELPDYMIPQYFIKLDEMPLTPNGKVSRKSLPEPEENIDTGAEYVASRTDTEKKLTQSWQKILGVEKVSVFDNFFALGGHSLKAVSLVADLQRNFEINVNDIFEHQTVAELAQIIKPKKDNLKELIMSLKDMGAEEEKIRREYMNSAQALDKIKEYNSINKKYENLNYRETDPVNCVLLTGATGYLGVHVLYELLTSRKCKIYTIIRADNDSAAKQRLKEKTDYYFGADFLNNYENRIEILKGDLGKSNLGLSGPKYSEMCEKVDSIINTAAIVKHYGHFDTFYNANVQSVINLIELAKTGKQKPLNHVSTLSVVEGYSPQVPHLLFGEYDFDLGQRNENYYVKTKFDAERVIFDAMKEGLTANIYRVGNISINSDTGHLQQNIEENAFYQQINAFMNMGVVPEQQDEVEFSFVNYLSKAIVMLFDRTCLKNETFHLFNSQMIHLSDILTDPALEINIRKLSFNLFVDYLYDNYENEYFRKYIENIMLHRGWMNSVSSENEDLTKKTTGFTLLSEKTDLILDRLSFKWPQLDVQKLNRMIVKTLANRIEFLKGLPLFNSMDANVIDAVAKLGRLLVFKEESNILWEGDENSNLYIIVEGSVEVSKTSGSGWIGTIGIFGAGSIFGEESLLGKEKSNVTMEALLGDTAALQFRASDIRRMITSNPELALNIIGEQREKMSRLEKILVNLG